jgi:hypothetical protein
MEANLEKMEPTSGEKEAAAEQQENPNAIHYLRAHRNERTACQEATEANPEKMVPSDRAIAILEMMEATDLKANPEEMESESGHREISKEDAVAKPVKGRKKRHRDRHLAAGRRGEPKELNRGDCGSQRKLAAACRKVPRRAAVVRRKGNVFWKIRTQGNCEPRKQLVAARREMTHRAKVARRKGQTEDDVAPRSPKGCTFGRRRWKGPEFNNDIRDRGLRQQLRGSKRIKDLGGRRPLCLRKARQPRTESEGGAQDSDHIWEAEECSRRPTLYEIFRGKIAKQVVGTSRFCRILLHGVGKR